MSFEFLKLCKLIDKLAMRMKGELFTKLNEGKRGWDDPADYEELQEALMENARQKKWLAVANLAAFLWYQDWRRFMGRDFLETGDEPEHQGYGNGL